MLVATIFKKSIYLVYNQYNNYTVIFIYYLLLQMILISEKEKKMGIKSKSLFLFYRNYTPILL